MNDDELEPEQDARIRALLAEVATTDEASLPPEVAARLDETLAGLVAARQETAQETKVIPLRRRWAPRAAAAAAAVIVVGAGGVAAANLGVFDGTSNSASDSGAAGGQAESFAGSASDTPAPTTPQAPTGAVALPRITSEKFDAEVARLVQQQDLARVQRGNTANLRKAQEDDQSNAVSGTVPGCRGPKADDGSQRETVLYDGTRAVLVVHPPKQGQQAVVAWTCEGDQVLARTSVPVSTDASGQSSPGDPGLGSPSPSP